MNELQIFAFVVLPLSIAAGGWAYAWFWERRDRARRRMHPGE
ncbi:hypothetical protein [Rhizobium paknamense]|uniref:Cytochrome bd-type quinol oxidase subunit 2 n=1 Tax=Rhizobium paknamense TaxID=1206817 RepID=A0ABU0I690_9HYPH|nr:hypothetical protein [Rhizobium paknamense]MDQ0453737.1 cytochrome bd-type quinol oxidase subunit 2 [Rhizobium paknamense]